MFFLANDEPYSRPDGPMIKSSLIIGNEQCRLIFGSCFRNGQAVPHVPLSRCNILVFVLVTKALLAPCVREGLMTAVSSKIASNKSRTAHGTAPVACLLRCGKRSHVQGDPIPSTTGFLNHRATVAKPMMKTFMLGSALSALMLSNALAQSSMSPPKTSPAAVTQAQSSSKADVNRSQKTDQWLPWSWDTTAIGSDDKNIGDLIPGQFGFIDQLKVSQNKDELKQTEHFTPYEPQPATTGMGPSMPPRGYGPFPPISPAVTPPAGQ